MSTVLSILHSARRAAYLLRRNAVDVVSYFALPLFLAVWPWTVRRALSRRVASWDWVFETRQEAIADAYAEWTGEQPPAGWVLRHRFFLLMDRVLLFRTIFSTPRRIMRKVRRVGDPVPEGPFVAASVHYGSGLSAFPGLRVHGMSFASISMPTRLRDYSGRLFLFWFNWLAVYQAVRLGGEPIQYSEGRFIWSVRKLLRRGTGLLALVDVPDGSAKHSRTARVLGRDAVLPTGLFELANMEHRPVVLFYACIDEDTGHITCVYRDVSGMGEHDAFDAMYRHFSEQLEKDSAPWHAWSWGSPAKGYRVRPREASPPPAPEARHELAG